MAIIVCLYIGFVFTGQKLEDSNDDLDDYSKDYKNFLAWFLLLTYPLVLATGSILNRKLRKLDENIVSSYGNFTQTIIWIVIVAVIG